MIRHRPWLRWPATSGARRQETARISSSLGVQGPLRVVQVSPSSAQKSARPAKKVRYLLPNTGRGYQDLRDTL